MAYESRFRLVAPLVAGLGTLACGGVGVAPTTGAPGAAPIQPSVEVPTAARHRLVVMVVIDQLPSWGYAARHAHYTQGLARLATHGWVWPEVELPYAFALTAPGHATLATGVTPRVHGVFGNEWYRRQTTEVAPPEWDPTSAMWRVGAQGGTVADHASGELLAVEGVGDVLKRERPTARVVALGLKSRAVCFVAGRNPDIAVFYEAAAGGMTTSQRYAPALPPWLTALAQTHPLAGYAARAWVPSDAALLQRFTQRPDAGPGEPSRDASFPHVPAQQARPLEAMTATPTGDAMVLDAARAAVAAYQLGADAQPDLLAISLNAHDFVGHKWGQESWELADLELALDRQLGEFWDFLDATLGKDAWAVVLTSDHGATPLPEVSGLPGAARVSPKQIRAAAEAALRQALGPGAWLLNVSTNNLYLAPAFTALPGVQQARATEAVRTALRKVAGIVEVYATRPLLAQATVPGQPPSCAHLAEVGKRALCESLHPVQAGDMVLVLADGALVSDYDGGTHHDAPSRFNRFVPVLMYAPGRTRAAVVAPTSLSVAPTLAALLGITLPLASAPSLVAP